MSYVDGFVIPVRKDRLEEYRVSAELGAKVWMANGASAYVECLADDAPYGELTSFPRAVLAEEGETIVFSWIVYPDKATRDACMRKVMADERLQASSMPFDGKRMIFGGFETFLER